MFNLFQVQLFYQLMKKTFTQSSLWLGWFCLICRGGLRRVLGLRNLSSRIKMWYVIYAQYLNSCWVAESLLALLLQVPNHLPVPLVFPKVVLRILLPFIGLVISAVGLVIRETGVAKCQYQEEDYYCRSLHIFCSFLWLRLWRGTS